MDLGFDRRGTCFLHRRRDRHLAKVLIRRHAVAAPLQLRGNGGAATILGLHGVAEWTDGTETVEHCDVSRLGHVFVFKGLKQKD